MAKQTEWPTATGILDGHIYQVRMTGDGWKDNARVERLFEQHKGREVEVPGHGVFTVKDTAEGVVALLLAETTVLRMDGRPPKAFTEVFSS